MSNEMRKHKEFEMLCYALDQREQRINILKNKISQLNLQNIITNTMTSEFTDSSQIHTYTQIICMYVCVCMCVCVSCVWCLLISKSTHTQKKANTEQLLRSQKQEITQKQNLACFCVVIV